MSIVDRKERDMSAHEGFLLDCWSSWGILDGCDEAESCGSSGASGNRFEIACAAILELKCCII